MTRIASIVVFLGASACTVEQAPGTRPSDMSAQAHLDACKKHLALAQEQDRRARYMYRVRGVVSAGHAGDRERTIAEQHGQAARAIDPAAPTCP